MDTRQLEDLDTFPFSNIIFLTLVNILIIGRSCLHCTNNDLLGMLRNGYFFSVTSFANIFCFVIGVFNDRLFNGRQMTQIYASSNTCV